jgi:hypothetical protein
MDSARKRSTLQVTMTTETMGIMCRPATPSTGCTFSQILGIAPGHPVNAQLSTLAWATPKRHATLNWFNLALAAAPPPALGALKS